jgi:hypothetical protein
MNEQTDDAFAALTEQWRARARDLMAKAEQARRPAEIVRLTAMASTLEWAASDLSWFAKNPHMASLLVSVNEEKQNDADG